VRGRVIARMRLVPPWVQIVGGLVAAAIGFVVLTV
jgi:hypothetical protein